MEVESRAPAVQWPVGTKRELPTAEALVHELVASPYLAAAVHHGAHAHQLGGSSLSRDDTMYGEREVPDTNGATLEKSNAVAFLQRIGCAMTIYPTCVRRPIVLHPPGGARKRCEILDHVDRGVRGSSADPKFYVYGRSFRQVLSSNGGRVRRRDRSRDLWGAGRIFCSTFSSNLPWKNRTSLRWLALS